MKTPRNDPVASSRKAHTVLTVTFIDGCQGLLVLAFKQGDLDEKLVAEYNEKFKGSLLILVTKSRSHMFDGSLTVEMWEQAMLHVFRRRRSELGLTAEARGLILADAFTGNSSAPERLRRQAWLDDNNIKVLESIPGGWSAHGQPNDAIHQYLRFLQKIYESITLGYQTNPLIRPKLEMMTSTTVQTHRRSMSDRDLIEKDLWAWWSMPKSLCRWAWVSRGYIDVETMAEWWGMSVEELKQDGKVSEETRRELYNMVTTPSLVPKFTDAEKATLDVPLEGEYDRVWLVDDETFVTPEDEHGARALQPQIRLGLERELARFRRESAEWGRKVDKGLRTARQKEKHAEFVKKTTRLLIFSRWGMLELAVWHAKKKGDGFLEKDTVALLVDVQAMKVAQVRIAADRHGQDSEQNTLVVASDGMP